MLIQKELEKKIMTLLAAALRLKNLEADCRVCGSWQPVVDGLARWVDSDVKSKAALSVAVGTPGRETYSHPSVSFAAKLTLYVRHELDATGELLVSLSDAVQSVIDDWQAGTYQREFTVFDLPSLSVDDLSVQAGSSPVVSGDKVAVAWPLTFSGSYREVEQTNN